MALPRAWGPSPAPGWRKTQGLSEPKVKKATKKAPASTPGPSTTPRALTPQQQAEGMFRSTLQQIRSLQTPVDTAAIAVPYTAAQTASTALGTGLAGAVTRTGQTSLDQYGAAHDERAQHAAQFGVMTGAGPGSTAQPGTTVPDQGSAFIAQQTQAQAAAASQAATAWNALLERAKAGAQSKALTDRAQSDSQLEMQLAGNIPTWAQNAEQLGFQKETAAQNYLLALGNAKDKRDDAYRSYLLDKLKENNSSAYQQGLLTVAGQNADTNSRNADLRAQANTDRNTHWSQVEKRLNKAAANKKNGLTSSDVNTILKTLKGGSGSSATKTKKGYKVEIENFDTTGGIPGTQHTIYSDTPGYTGSDTSMRMVPGSVAQDNLVAGPAEAAKFSWSRYKQAVNVARTLASQRGVKLTDAQIRAMLGPTPKTTKKK